MREDPKVESMMSQRQKQVFDALKGKTLMQREIAKEIGVGDSIIQHPLEKLIEKGLVVRVEGKRYRLSDEAQREVDEDAAIAEALGVESANDANNANKG